MSAMSYDMYPVVLQAIELFGQGRTITDSCDEAGVSIVAFENYVKRDPQLQELYLDAERRSHDALADALINIDNHRIHGQANPQMAKVISENIKWVLSKRDTKRFGEKLEVKHELTMDRAIVQALEHARARTALPPPTDIVDAEYTVLDPVEAQELDDLLS